MLRVSGSLKRDRRYRVVDVAKLVGCEVNGLAAFIDAIRVPPKTRKRR